MIVFHAYDGKYYVSSISSTGEFFASEFDQSTFNSTYGKYLSNTPYVMSKKIYIRDR